MPTGLSRHPGPAAAGACPLQAPGPVAGSCNCPAEPKEEDEEEKEEKEEEEEEEDEEDEEGAPKERWCSAAAAPPPPLRS